MTLLFALLFFASSIICAGLVMTLPEAYVRECYIGFWLFLSTALFIGIVGVA